MKVKDKKVMHFFIAIILDLLISVLIPAGNGLTDIGVRAIGAAVATVYLWTFVATDWTSIGICLRRDSIASWNSAIKCLISLFGTPKHFNKYATSII